MKFFVNRTGWHYLVQDNELYLLVRPAKLVKADNPMDSYYATGDIELRAMDMTEEYANNNPLYYSYEADTLEEAEKVKHPNQISQKEWMKMLEDVNDLCNEYCEDKPIEDNTPMYKEDF